MTLVPRPQPASIDPEDDNTMYALVRRFPGGGYAVAIGTIEMDQIPTIDEYSDTAYMTLAGAVRFAQGAGLYSIHPECYRAPTRIAKGL